jgi:gas vesicle protein
MIREIRDVLNGNYKRHSRNNVIVGVSAGLIAGAIVGLLFAPKSGKETRAFICEETKAGVKKVKEVIQGVEEKAGENLEKVAKSMKKDSKESTETKKEETEKVNAKA